MRLAAAGSKVHFRFKAMRAHAGTANLRRYRESPVRTGERCLRRRGGVRPQRRPHGGRRRQGHGRLPQAPRGGARRRAICRDHRCGENARQSCGLLAAGSPARPRTAIKPGQGLSRALGPCRQTNGGRDCRTGRRTRSEGQALQRPRMVEQSVLRLSQAGLSSHSALGRPAGARRRGPRSPHPAKGGLLRAPDRQRDFTVELRADQSGAAARNACRQGRESGARHAHAGRGHPGRTWQSPHPPIRIPRCSRSAAIWP